MFEKNELPDIEDVEVEQLRETHEERQPCDKQFRESRSESRTILDKYYSVQFSLSRMDPAYLFKLRDISSNGYAFW